MFMRINIAIEHIGEDYAYITVNGKEKEVQGLDKVQAIRLIIKALLLLAK